MLGTQPYTDTNTARDNFLQPSPLGVRVIIIISFFPIRLPQRGEMVAICPTKWDCRITKVGLNSDLRTVDDANSAEVNIIKQVSSMLDDINKSKASKTMSLPARLPMCEIRRLN